jgi:hypothetical protein
MTTLISTHVLCFVCLGERLYKSVRAISKMPEFEHFDVTPSDKIIEKADPRFRTLFLFLFLALFSSKPTMTVVLDPPSQLVFRRK